MTSQSPDGYVFGVADTALCCWEYDHVERNVRFLCGLDTEYYWRLAEILAEHLDGDGGGTASIALRAAYHQGIETLFKQVGGHSRARPSAARSHHQPSSVSSPSAFSQPNCTTAPSMASDD